MNINSDGKGFKNYIKSFIIEILVTAAMIMLFALVMYFFETGYKYAAVFATVSVAAGSFAAAFFTARKNASKGLLTGLIVGGITFIVITLISLIINHGGLTSNTLFHLIIIMLASMIGGIVGVNRSNRHKYI